MAEHSVDDVRVRRALGVMRALKHSAEDAGGEAQRRAPVEEGTLRASLAIAYIVNGHRFDGERAYEEALAAVVELARHGASYYVEAEVSFNTVYAARQHEELDWNHPKGGQSKYLESVIQERAGRYARAFELEDRLAGVS